MGDGQRIVGVSMSQSVCHVGRKRADSLVHRKLFERLLLETLFIANCFNHHNSAANHCRWSCWLQEYILVFSCQDTILGAKNDDTRPILISVSDIKHC